jgi:transcriptional regulator with XRE-family HTH domain
VRRGKTALTLVKAARHDSQRLNTPLAYRSRGLEVIIDADSHTPGAIDLGSRIRILRTRRGLSQTELARSVGVTPSTISQVEHNQIYPSLPALYKISEILGVEMGALFERAAEQRLPVVFAASQARVVSPTPAWRGAALLRRLLPDDFEAGAEFFLVEISPGARVGEHFLVHKGQEAGYLESGELILRLDGGTQSIHGGDLVYLKRETPAGWENPGSQPARLLWVVIR